ncbi:MAG: 6-carboxytetrahydropterin synthase [Polyangiaceae bacterium]|nr:6-carboxytetrahydropterin synthase [Polyangiaceae bacterium]MBK8940364.1 6-carboxytetrahydropterin synthase [Polyangiaceae bacterium]
MREQGVHKLVHTVRFESARRLPKTPPTHPCHNVYGLAFYLDIHVVGRVDPATGWVFDFAEIERAMKPLYDRIDHHYLNDVEGLENPTSEVLVTWLWDHLQPKLPGLVKLVLRENDVSRVIYRG